MFGMIALEKVDRLFTRRSDLGLEASVRQRHFNNPLDQSVIFHNQDNQQLSIHAALPATSFWRISSEIRNFGFPWLRTKMHTAE